MKVVLFCGGYGMRMRNSSDDAVPKPMQMVGPRPLIWHVMRYYAHSVTRNSSQPRLRRIHIKNYLIAYQEGQTTS
jgi:glucose-1-phosphate cytidylyltransferase